MNGLQVHIHSIIDLFLLVNKIALVSVLRMLKTVLEIANKLHILVLFVEGLAQIAIIFKLLAIHLDLFIKRGNKTSGQIMQILD